MTATAALRLILVAALLALTPALRASAAGPVAPTSTPTPTLTPAPAPAPAPAPVAADAAAVVAAANAAYERGVELKRSDPDAARRAFDAAGAGYAEALRLVGPNGWLFFNLGNAHLQEGRVGEAILAFRGAERLLGGDSRVQGGLSYARSLRRDQLAPRGASSLLRPIVDARHLLGPRVRLGLALGLNALFWAALFVRIARPGAGVPVAALLGLGLLVAVLSATVAIDTVEARRIRDGVLLADEVVLRTGNGDGFDAATAERLGAGIELTVIERRPGWLRVRLPDGTEGWLREEQVGMVGATG